MSARKRRIDDLGPNLTPTEIVLRWLDETLKLHSMHDFIVALKGKPNDAWPLIRLPKEAENAVRSSMKGKPWDEINSAEREAIRDVIFLYYLHINLNCKVADEIRAAKPMTGMLLLEVAHEIGEDARRRKGCHVWMFACQDIPYPLDAEAVVMVETSLANRVETWDTLEDGGIVGGMGARGALPAGT